MSEAEWAALSALAATVAALAAIGGAAIAAIAARGQRVEFLTALRAQWEGLVDDWATSILLHSGSPDWYYSQVSTEERQRVRDLMALVRRESTTDAVNALRAETKAARRVARFLAYAADAVLRGRVSVRDAYAVFGPDVARQRDFVLWVAGRNRVRPEGPMPQDGWIALVDQIHEGHFYDEQDAIVMLANLLSAESARRGDTYPHLVGSLARKTRSEFDRGALRITLWRLLHLRASWWRFPWLYKKLRWLTRPGRSVARRPESRIIQSEDLEFFRRGWRTRVRADHTLKNQPPFPR